MKAILVVDLDDDISRYHADIYKEDDKGNGEIVKSYCPLKPMPPHEKALMFGSEFEMFSEKVGEIVLDAIGEME